RRPEQPANLGAPARGIPAVAAAVLVAEWIDHAALESARRKRHENAAHRATGAPPGAEPRAEPAHAGPDRPHAQSRRAMADRTVHPRDADRAAAAGSAGDSDRGAERGRWPKPRLDSAPRRGTGI